MDEAQEPKDGRTRTWAMVVYPDSVPENWKGMDVIMDFEGVESAFYLWINGKMVGYSEDSRLPAHFNISKFLKKGKNRLAMKVFRFSDGS